MILGATSKSLKRKRHAEKNISFENVKSIHVLVPVVNICGLEFA